MKSLVARRAEAERRVDDLAAELADLEATTDEGPDDEHDPEGATIGYERARVHGLLDRARAEVAGLAAAEVRRRDGTYGTCRTCGRDIGPERLDALPAATQCYPCAAAGSATA